MRSFVITQLFIISFCITGMYAQVKSKPVRSKNEKPSEIKTSPAFNAFDFLIIGKYRSALKLAEDKDLVKAVEALFTVNRQAAESFRPKIGKQVTVTLRGIPLTGTLVSIKNNSLYLKLKRGSGTVVMPVKMSKLPIDDRLTKAVIPELSKKICMITKFFRQKNYKAASVFIADTGKFSKELQAALTRRSRYFMQLLDASRRGDNKKIDELLKMGADINGRISAMMPVAGTKKYKLVTSTLLIETIKAKSAETAKYLVEKGADVNLQDSKGVSPVMFAIIAFDDADLLEFLVKKGADLKHRDMKGNTVLTGEVAMGKKPAVEFLLKHKVDPDEANSHGFTPVMVSILTNNPEMLKILLKAGADIAKPHPKGWNVFQIQRTRMAPELRAILNSLEPDKPIKKKSSSGSFPGGMNVIRR